MTEVIDKSTDPPEQHVTNPEQDNPDWLPEWERKILDKQQALAEYQDASNEIHYATGGIVETDADPEAE